MLDARRLCWTETGRGKTVASPRAKLTRTERFSSVKWRSGRDSKAQRTATGRHPSARGGDGAGGGGRHCGAWRGAGAERAVTGRPDRGRPGSSPRNLVHDAGREVPPSCAAAAPCRAGLDRLERSPGAQARGQALRPVPSAPRSGVQISSSWASLFQSRPTSARSTSGSSGNA